MSAGEHPVSAVVEGITDRAVLARLVEEAGLSLGSVHGLKGKEWIRARIAQYNRAAEHSPWVVIVDLDSDAPCAASLVSGWVPQRAPRFCLRVAVREVESWLMADASELARYLGISASVVPADVDALTDPKSELVSLARRSPRRAIRQDMLREPGSGRSEGPAYASRMIEFARYSWRPAVAEQRSDSLRRCRLRLAQLAKSVQAE